VQIVFTEGNDVTTHELQPRQFTYIVAANCDVVAMNNDAV